MTVSSIVFHTPLTKQLGYLFDLTDQMSSALMSQMWSTQTIELVLANKDQVGAKLPASASPAAERLGYKAVDADGIYTSTRVKRIAQANVVSQLRTLADRDRSLVLLCETGEVRDQHPEVRAGIAKKLAHQARKYAKANPDVDPRTFRLAEIQPPPRTGRKLNFAATDKQFASLRVENYALTVEFRVPAGPQTATAKDWERATLSFIIPEHLRGREITKWSLPTITPHPTRSDVARVNFAYGESNVPQRRNDKDPITSVIGVDWSPTDLLIASHVRLDTKRYVSAFEGHRFDDRGLREKLERLQHEGELLSAKVERHAKYVENLDAEHPLAVMHEAKIADLKKSRKALGRKRQKINRDLAFLAANWVLGLAERTGATSIAYEKLSTLEAGGLGKQVNNKVAQSARSQTLEALHHLAARRGFEAVSVAAQGTSKKCPGCDQALSRPKGYLSASCRACGNSGNRDQFASVNVGKRLIVGQKSIKRDFTTKRKAVKKIEHAPVKRVSRDKNAPTSSRPKTRRARVTPVHVPNKLKKVNPSLNNLKPAQLALVWGKDPVFMATLVSGFADVTPSDVTTVNKS